MGSRLKKLALAAHRKAAMCRCDLSYIVTGESRQKTTRLCANPEVVHVRVRNAIHLHDRVCYCGCFNAARYLGKKHLVDIQGRPDLRKKVVLKGLTAGDWLCISGISLFAFIWMIVSFLVSLSVPSRPFKPEPI